MDKNLFSLPTRILTEIDYIQGILFKIFQA